MFLPIVFLFLINISFSVASPDQFVFNVTFTCNHNENYQYKIKFVEWDWWLFNGDDVIIKERTGVAPPGVFNVMMVGILNGDEITSEGYDVRMIMSHSCTKSHKEVSVYMYIKPHCEIGKGICHFKITKDITDVEGEITNYANLVYF